MACSTDVALNEWHTLSAFAVTYQHRLAMDQLTGVPSRGRNNADNIAEHVGNGPPLEPYEESAVTPMRREGTAWRVFWEYRVVRPNVMLK